MVLPSRFSQGTPGWYSQQMPNFEDYATDPAGYDAAVAAWVAQQNGGPGVNIPPHMLRDGMSQGEYDANYLNNRANFAAVQVRNGNPDHPNAKGFLSEMTSRMGTRPEQFQSAYNASTAGLGGPSPILNDAMLNFLESGGYGTSLAPVASTVLGGGGSGGSRETGRPSAGFPRSDSSPGAKSVDPVTGAPVDAFVPPPLMPGMHRFEPLVEGAPVGSGTRGNIAEGYAQRFGPDQTFIGPGGETWFSAHPIGNGPTSPGMGNGPSPVTGGQKDPRGFGPAPSQPGNPVIPGQGPGLGNAPSQPGPPTIPGQGFVGFTPPGGNSGGILPGSFSGPPGDYSGMTQAPGMGGGLLEGLRREAIQNPVPPGWSPAPPVDVNGFPYMQGGGGSMGGGNPQIQMAFQEFLKRRQMGNQPPIQPQQALMNGGY